VIMTALLFLICYLAAVVFVVACLVRMAIYARAPIHFAGSSILFPTRILSVWHMAAPASKRLTG
jgi:energy-converting hydrogenase Eha subunit A